MKLTVSFVELGKLELDYIFEIISMNNISFSIHINFIY